MTSLCFRCILSITFSSSSVDYDFLLYSTPPASCKYPDNVFLLILFFCNLQLGYKSLFCIHHKISIIIWIFQHASLLTLCISVFTFFNIYLGIGVFTLFLKLYHCCCISIYFVLWIILTMKIWLYLFFLHFQLTKHLFTFSFYRNRIYLIPNVSILRHYSWT